MGILSVPLGGSTHNPAPIPIACAAAQRLASIRRGPAAAVAALQLTGRFQFDSHPLKQ